MPKSAPRCLRIFCIRLCEALQFCTAYRLFSEHLFRGHFPFATAFYTIIYSIRLVFVRYFESFWHTICNSILVFYSYCQSFAKFTTDLTAVPQQMSAEIFNLLWKSYSHNYVDETLLFPKASDGAHSWPTLIVIGNI